VTEAPNNSQSGYCNPPKHTRFAKGQSGNPKGRPKGSQNIASLLMKEARKKISLKIGGQIKTVTKLEGVVIQLLNKAAGGDLRALQMVLYWENAIRTSAQTDLLPLSLVFCPINKWQ
jgi:hypothetical protein